MNAFFFGLVSWYLLSAEFMSTNCNEYSFQNFTDSFESQAIYLSVWIPFPTSLVFSKLSLWTYLGSGDWFCWQSYTWGISIILCACWRGKDFWKCTVTVRAEMAGRHMVQLEYCFQISFCDVLVLVHCYMSKQPYHFLYSDIWAGQFWP